MALVKHLSQRSLERDAPHQEVDCTYTIVSDEQGQRYLQVDTYGSNSRKIRGKKSQSIRFSAQAVAQIKEIISGNFWTTPDADTVRT